jgi:hypothetical protein
MLIPVSASMAPMAWVPLQNSCGSWKSPICEGTNIDLSNAYTNFSDAWTLTKETRLTPAAEYAPSATMEQYLARAYNHGAVLVNLFGWDRSHADAASATAIIGTPAIRAYRKFLKGEPLTDEALAATAPHAAGSMSSMPGPNGSALQSSERVQELSDKMRRIQREVLPWVKAHPERKPELESLFQQLTIMRARMI